MFSRAQGESIRRLESLRGGLRKEEVKAGEPNRVGVSIERFQRGQRAVEGCVNRVPSG